MTAREDAQLSIWQPIDHPLGNRQVLRVAVTDEDRHGHLELAQPVPQRLHLARTEASQYRRQRVGAVAALVLTRQLADRWWFVREQRLRAPALDELLERRHFQRQRQRPVSLAPSSALADILDACAARDKHQPAHALGSSERHMKCDAPSQRVSAQREALGGNRKHRLHAAGERDWAPRIACIAMPGQVEREWAVAFMIEQLQHTVPRAPRAAEPVKQDDAVWHPTIV